MRRPILAVAGLALLAAGSSLALQTVVFPYHSVNHDEGVYLQQAAMLLEGQLFLRPPVPEAFRPWFFVRDGARLYPKYAPVPAATFAVGELVGDYRLALAGVAAATVSLTHAVVAELFDARRGLLAAALLVASPLFLVHAAVFLPYLPTFALNLLFALAYLRSDRTGSRRWAALAGVAVGLAFFARPYTAVLFAAPFVTHAGFRLRGLDGESARRLGVTAALGLAGVAVALGYNALVTGGPFRFPYTAFAPLDGPGFGRRELLGHAVDYTPGLAVRANAEVLWELGARWVVAGPVGTALALVGAAHVARELRRDPEAADHRRLVLCGLVLAVVVGNLAFWGNLNLLGALADPADGLVHLLGPYYHLDLLLPTVALAAHAVVVSAGAGRRAVHRRLDGAAASRAVLAAAVLSTALLGGAAVGVAAEPIADNRAASAHLADAYRPFETRDLENAVVFLPSPLGDWLNHPFQALRNDPGYDGPVVYALEERPLAVVDAFPDRRVYRYSYRGTWAPTAGRSVEPTLRELEVVEGEAVTLRLVLGVPDDVESVSVRVAGDDAAYFLGDPGRDRLHARLLVEGERARLAGSVTPVRGATVSVAEARAVTVEVFLERPDGGGLTYLVRLPVETGDEVRAVSPHLEACLEPLRCGGGAAYVPGATPPDVSMRAELSAT